MNDVNKSDAEIGAGASAAPSQNGDSAAQRARLTVGLLTGAGFLAAVASFFTDLSVSDATAATAAGGGLAVFGVAAAATAALRVVLRRRSFDARVEELQTLRQEISGQHYKEIGDAATRQMLLLLDARIGELEARLGRTGWRQGAVFAVATTAAAVAIVVFGHWLPELK